jgi:hypothetical protein
LQRQRPGLVQGDIDVDAAASVAQRPVLRRIGDQLVDHERDGRERLRFDQDLGSAHDDAIGTAAEIGAGLGVDQRAERGRSPVIGGDLVMRAGERVNTATDDPGEGLDRVC